MMMMMMKLMLTYAVFRERTKKSGLGGEKGGWGGGENNKNTV